MGKTGTLLLPRPRRSSRVSIEGVLGERRSVREFEDGPLSLGELSQLLWAAQGVTAPDGGRAAPSAGATYPMEISAVAGDVTGLEAGVYRYEPTRHRILLVAGGDQRKALARASLDQDWMARAPLCLALAAVESRTAHRYRERSARYVQFEAGCVSENVARLARFVAGIDPNIPYALLAFAPHFLMADLPTTSRHQAEAAEAAAREAGLRNVRVGNRHLLGVH